MKKILLWLGIMVTTTISYAQLMPNHDTKIYFENCQQKLSAHFFLFNDGNQVKLINYNSGKFTIYSLTATAVNNGYKFEGENLLWYVSVSDTAYRNYHVSMSGQTLVDKGILLLGKDAGQKTPTYRVCPDNAPASLGLDRPDFYEIRKMMPSSNSTSSGKSALSLFNQVEREISKACQRPREACAGSNNYKLCLERINASHCY